MLKSCSRRSCCVAGIFAGGLYLASQRLGRSIHSGGQTLVDILPNDLDQLESPTIISALGVQLLLFSGWQPRAGGWQRSPRAPTSLAERVDLVAPTWKPGGSVDYSEGASRSAELLPGAATLPLFAASTSAALSVPGAGTTVSSLARALEGLGLDADADLDSEARRALVEMLTWRLPVSSEDLKLSTGAREDLTLLVLSFDATPLCKSVDDCPQPGPSNELLAATAEAFVRHRARKYAQKVHVVAQWEVAAAMRSHGSRARVSAVGTPGRFENTAQIYEHMLGAMGASGMCVDGEPSATTSRVGLLSHPDHLRRAICIGETSFARAASSVGRACAPVRLVPAMQPYRLDWPMQPTSSGETRLNLFAGVSASVHTRGETKLATWYDHANGYFPDGEPQRWAHSRSIWICYEFWARAKGVATGIIERRT